MVCSRAYRPGRGARHTTSATSPTQSAPGAGAACSRTYLLTYPTLTLSWCVPWRLSSGAGRHAYSERDKPDTICSRRGCGLFTDLPLKIPYPNAIMVCALAPTVRGGAPRVQRARRARHDQLQARVRLVHGADGRLRRRPRASPPPSCAVPLTVSESPQVTAPQAPSGPGPWRPLQSKAETWIRPCSVDWASQAANA
jgi:hypothetical protein